MAVAGEHDVEHARADGDGGGLAVVEVVIVLLVGGLEVELLNVRPAHALAAGDAVLQIDVLLVGLQIRLAQRAGIALGDGGEQAVFQLIAAALQIRRFREEGKGEFHIGMERIVALLFFNAIDNHVNQPPWWIALL